jgi:hypothetical protein
MGLGGHSLRQSSALGLGHLHSAPSIAWPRPSWVCGLHGPAQAGDGTCDERVEAAPDVAFPARHGRDVGLLGLAGHCSARGDLNSARADAS